MGCIVRRLPPIPVPTEWPKHGEHMSMAGFHNLAPKSSRMCVRCGTREWADGPYCVQCAPPGQHKEPVVRISWWRPTYRAVVDPLSWTGLWRRFCNLFAVMPRTCVRCGWPYLPYLSSDIFDNVRGGYQPLPPPDTCSDCWQQMPTPPRGGTAEIYREDRRLLRNELPPVYPDEEVAKLKMMTETIRKLSMRPSEREKKMAILRPDSILTRTTPPSPELPHSEYMRQLREHQQFQEDFYRAMKNDAP